MNYIHKKIKFITSEESLYDLIYGKTLRKKLEKLAIIDNDLEFYQRSVEMAAEKYGFDLRDHLDEVDSEFETN